MNTSELVMVLILQDHIPLHPVSQCYNLLMTIEKYYYNDRIT